MSDTQPTLLPLELCGLVIDFLAEDDKELTTIRACSLASRAFLPLTRKHIFASIEINDPFANRWPNTEAFVTLISRNPEIGEYVHKFEYCITKDDHIMFPMPHILGNLTKLKSLGIWHHSGDKLPWRTQRWSMRSALLRLMQLPSLSALRLEWIEDFPVSDLIHSSSLKHLKIQYTDFTEDIVPPSTVHLPRKSVYLHEYDVGLQCASTTKKLVEAYRPDGLPIVDFTELAKVTANCDNKEDIDAIQTIFVRANQLQIINLTISESLTYIGLAEMVMGSIQTLKTLILSATIDDSSEDPLSHLCHELESVSATGRCIIETLSINVGVSTDADCKRGDEWGALDGVLTKKDAWLGLKEVSLKIQVYNYERVEEDDIMEALSKLHDTQFKRLSASETINFKFKVTEEDI